jgi:hypothetical protein
VSTCSSIDSFEAFVTIYLSITMINYTKDLIIKLFLLKKASKKRNNEIITQYLTGSTMVKTRVVRCGRVHGMHVDVRCQNKK